MFARTVLLKALTMLAVEPLVRGFTPKPLFLLTSTPLLAALSDPVSFRRLLCLLRGTRSLLGNLYGSARALSVADWIDFYQCQHWHCFRYIGIDTVGKKVPESGSASRWQDTPARGSFGHSALWGFLSTYWLVLAWMDIHEL